MIVSGGKSLGFAPQALGEVTPIASATGYFYSQPGLFVGDHYAAYGSLYREQPSLATVVDKVANAAARLSFQVWNQTTTGKELDESSPFAKLWKRPCPVLPAYSFWRWTISTYELYGEAYWMKIRNRPGGDVIGLFPMHPTRVEIKRDPDDATVTYIFTLGVASAGLLTLPESEVVPFRRYNPENLMRGMSRAEPLRSTLANEDAARRAMQAAWRRGARPGLMIGSENVVSEGAVLRLQAQITAQHGGPDNAGKSLLLEEGMKPYPVQFTAAEMEYTSARQLNMQEVCMVYDVPPPVVHILDHATFSNITEQMRSMYRDTMAPRLEDIESVIDHYLRVDFDQSGDVCARFALDEVLRGDFETRAAAVQKLVQIGTMKPSEARVLFDLPDAGAIADKLYANAALQELGKPAERVSLTETGLPPTPAQQDLMDQTQQDAAENDAASAADEPTNGGKRQRRRTVRKLARRAESEDSE